MTTTQPTFIVTYDGEIDTELSVLPPTPIEVAAGQMQAAAERLAAHLALQTRMALFDTIHRTHYRRIRNDLAEQQKRAAFERSIGIERK